MQGSSWALPSGDTVRGLVREQFSSKMHREQDGYLKLTDGPTSGSLAVTHRITALRSYTPRIFHSGFMLLLIISGNAREVSSLGRFITGTMLD